MCQSCDSMDKHASTMRQALMVEQPKFFQQYIAVSPNGNDANSADIEEELDDETDDEEVAEVVPPPPFKGVVTARDRDMLFGTE